MAASPPIEPTTSPLPPAPGFQEVAVSAPVNPLLSGPVLSTLVRLAVPNVLAMTMAVLVGVAETFYVGRLGIAPLAAMALVFPFNMLTNMMSGGAMGGGVSSAISRALGAGDGERANATAQHAVLIGLGVGLAYSAIFLVCGPVLYRWLGGRDAVLEQAVAYASVLFSGAVLIWVMNTLASIVRGTGNMRLPSVTILVISGLQIVFGGVLSLGFGSFEGFGLRGIAVGQILATSLGVSYLYLHLVGGRGRVRLRWSGMRIEKRLFADILRVGALACLVSMQTVTTVLVLTGLISRLGVEALAGYGIGQRLEFLLIPVAFGIGVAAVPMVGMAIGAGDVARARRVAWISGGLSGLNLTVIGLVVSVWPDLWAGLFTSEEAVLVHARQYLHWAGPCFGLFGFGLTLYFASQGSGKVLGAVLAASLRLLMVVTVGLALKAAGAPAWAYFALIGAAMIFYGVASAAAVWLTPWGRVVRR